MKGIGIIGCGKISQVRHIPEYYNNPNAEIIGYYDLAKERAAEMAARYGGKVYDSVDELLADPAIDAVSVCVANNMHADVTVAALKAGKHVLCEKPMATNIADCERMVFAAKQYGKSLMIGQNQRFAKAHEEARRLIKAGGKVERETRRFDEEKKVTFSARKKEFEADYGYIGEPDLGIYHIARIAEGIELKESPLVRIDRFRSEYGMDERAARQMINTSMGLADLFERLAKETDAATAMKWTSGAISASWRAYEQRGEDRADEIADIVKRFAEGSITDTQCNLELRSVMTGSSAEGSAEVSADLEALIEKAIDDNPSVLNDYRKNEKAANRIIGAVMKQTGGAYSSADIVSATKRLIERRL